MLNVLTAISNTVPSAHERDLEEKLQHMGEYLGLLGE